MSLTADSDPLIIVSNRGPAQFERDEEGQRTVRRGGGGLVTALSGLVSHRDALWIASAMTDEDVAVSRGARAGRSSSRSTGSTTACCWSAATPRPTTASTT